MSGNFLHDRLQQLEDVFPEKSLLLSPDMRISWRETGGGKADVALVLLHGISSSAPSWFAVAREVQRLAADVRVLAWDAPGYGQSMPLLPLQPVDTDYAGVLEAWLRALTVRQCVLVGHSLGALMAAAHARQQTAGQITHLVLISPAGGYGAPETAAQRVKVYEGRLNDLEQKGVAGLSADVDKRLAAPDASENVRLWLRFNAARMQAGGYRQAVHLLCAADLGQSVGKLAMPVHVWVGEQDKVTLPDACARWAEKLSAQHEIIPSAGHAAPVEQPEWIAEKLAGLLL